MHTELRGGISGDVEGGVKASDGANKGLAQTQTAAPKKGDECHSPNHCVHRIGRAEGTLQCEEVINRDGNTRGVLVHNTLLVGSDAALLNPVVIANPWGIVVQVPSVQA